MKIVTEDTLAHSKAFVFVMEQFVQLLKEGLSDMETPFGNNFKVTYMITEDTGEVVSAIVWGNDLSRRISTLNFVCTAYEHRRKGYYTQLFNEVQRLMKSKGSTLLYYNVHTNNSQMLNFVNNSNGGSPTSIRVKKPL